MRHRFFAAIAASFAMTVLLGAAAISGSGDDPYLWLEETEGKDALNWVEGRNAIALSRLKSDPTYQSDYDTILSILDAPDRIPAAGLHGEWAFNFWQDEDNVRGIWRRTKISSYRAPSPQWETLLDIDKLAAAENKNWIFKGSDCSPGLNRCLVALSPGGGDTVVWREFDMTSRAFTPDGFTLPEAKAEAAYFNDNTILFSTDFGSGTLTKSGYPRIVKLWRRGQVVADAAAPNVYFGPGGSLALIERDVSFFETEYHVLTEGGRTVKLPLPLYASVRTAFGGDLLLTLRQDWTPEGNPKIAQGSLVAFALKEFLATRKMPRVSVLYTPDARSTINGVQTSRDAVYASVFENVTGSIRVFTRGNNGWTSTRLNLPEGGSTRTASANPFGPEAHVTHQGFLNPNTLYETDGAKVTPLKALPAKFDAAPYEQAQYEATSADGTKIPYFLVRAKNASGPQPMVLYGYGGFEISMPPFYWSNAGKVWLSRGGAYAIANIRGGGEFGPAWHEAALKENRQKAFDDFIAVAEDMIRRGLTTPAKLGIMGGSNGGLLVGTVAVQRPDLFGAVVCQVPLLDMIRFPLLGAGASWVGEYGDPEIPAERAAILKYSPYQNVKPGTKYPSIFFVTATSDDRVTPVHARKMAAKMEAQGHEVLFYENRDGGHAAAANHAQQAEMNALTFAYFRQELGVTSSP
jgi:prolyl oligopeptidase